MKKPKMSLGPDGVKGLFVQHVEKAIVGLAVVLVFVFIIMGYGLKSDLGTKTPDLLKTKAVQARDNVQASSAKALESERTPRGGEGGQYEQRLLVSNIPVGHDHYPMGPWKPPTAKPGLKREDPAVFAPIKLETTALTGALCIKAPDDMENAIADLKNSPAPDKPKKKKKKKRRTGGAFGSGGYPGGEGSDGMDPGSDFGDGGYPGSSGDETGRDRGSRKKGKEPIGPERIYPSDKVCGYRPSGVSAGGSGYPGGGMGSGAGMGSGVGMPGSGSGAGGVGAPGAGAAGGSGMMAGPGSGMSGGPGGGTTPGTGDPLAISANVIAVKALAPYRKQADEFKRVLGDATGYDPVRDRPRMIFFQAQRVDVTDDPSKAPEEADWQMIMHPNKARSIAEGKGAKYETWHGFLPEVADRTYVDPSITMPGPPIMLRCMDEAMLHTEVPLATTGPTLETPADDGSADGDVAADDAADSDLPGSIVGSGSRGGSGHPGMGGSGGYPGMGGSGGYPGMGGSGYPGSGAGGGYPGMDGGDGDETGSSYAGSGSGSGMGAFGGSMSGSMEPVQYKLIRFFDLDVKPGRVYRYRIRLFVEDPNHPNTDPAKGFVSAPPRRRTLSDAVRARLDKQQADDAKKSAYYVITDWSEPTAPVTLPSPARVFVGSAQPARVVSGIGKTRIVQSEPRGTVVPVVWNEQLAIDVSSSLRAYRGTVTDMKDDFDVLDPVTLVIKILEDYEFRNQYLVVDIRGGEDLPGNKKIKVSSAGEYALVDDQGRFVVRNELDDFKQFNRFTFKDEIKSRFGSSSGMGDGEYPGMGSGGNMPGMGGGSGYPGFGSGAGGSSPGAPPGNPGAGSGGRR